VRRIEVVELLDASTMPDPDFAFVMGMGSDPAALDLLAGPLAALYGRLYGEAIALTCDRMRVAVDEIASDHRIVCAERDPEIGAAISRPGRSRRPSGAGTRSATGSGS
jgi:2,4-diaminopentanoate dehydrogenase